MPAKKTYLWLALTIGIITIARLMIFFSVAGRTPEHLLTPDSPGYLSPAMALVQTGRFAVSPEQPAQPEWMRTPGYPLFLGAVLALSNGRLEPVGVLQIILSAVTLAITSWLAYRISASPRAALFTGLLLAFDLPTFLHTQLILTETLFTLLVVLSSVFGVLWLTARGRGKQYFLALGCGISIAAATQIKPIAYYLPFFLVAGLLAAAASHKIAWKRVIPAAGLLILPWMLLVGSWQVRNLLVVGCPDFSRIEGINMLYYRGAGIIAQREHISLLEAQNQLREQLGTTSQSNQRSCGPEKAAGLRIIRSNPGLFLVATAKGLGNFLLDSNGGDFLLYLNEYYPSSPLDDVRNLPLGEFVNRWALQHPFSLFIYIYARVAILGMYVLLAVGLLEVWTQRNRRPGIDGERQPVSGSAVLYLILLGVYFALVSAGPEAYARFRVPIMPFVCIFAGWGLEVVVGKVKAARMNRTTPGFSKTSASQDLQ